MPSLVHGFISFALLTATATTAFAQEASPGSPPPDRDSGVHRELPPPAPLKKEAFNGVYLELLGPGVLYSINYERRFGDVFARIGLGPLSAIRNVSGEPVERWD